MRPWKSIEGFSAEQKMQTSWRFSRITRSAVHGDLELVAFSDAEHTPELGWKDDAP